MNIGASFTLKLNRSGVEMMFFVLIQIAFSYPICCSPPLVRCFGCSYQICYRPLLWLIISQANISTSTFHCIL